MMTGRSTLWVGNGREKACMVGNRRVVADIDWENSDKGWMNNAGMAGDGRYGSTGRDA